MPNLRAAVVGTAFGGRVHVPALRNAGFDVVALVGRDVEKTAGLADSLGIPTALGSLDEALDLVDAVSIATPPDTHASLSIKALEAGKAVICEKPFALDAAEAEAMSAAADAAGVPAYIGHEFRWAVDRALIARAIDDGLIGEPRLASFVGYAPFVPDPAVARAEWWFDRERGGGWLGASGSHVLDQIRVWLGDVASVEATLPLVSERPEGVAEDSFVAHMTMANGCDVVLQQTGGSWGPSASVTRVAGPRGTVWSEAGDVFVADRSGTRQLPVPDDLRLPDLPVVEHAGHFTHIELAPFTRLAEALHAAMEGRPTASGPRPATFADGVAVMKLIDAIRHAAATGRRQVL